MSKRKHVLLGLGSLGCLALLGGALLLWLDSLPQHWPSRATYERVRVGMTYQEVKETLGEGYGGLHRDCIWVGDPNIGPKQGCRGSTWFGDEIVIQVWFGETDGLVADKEFRELVPPPRPSLLSRIGRWLGV